MGWSFSCNNSKAQEVESIVNGFVEGCSARKHRLVGNHLWMIVDTPNGTFIGLALLQSGGPGCGYGHKFMDEAMGPAYYDCPVSYLDEVPQPESRFSSDWRDKVRKHHAAKQVSKRMAAGQVWRMAAGYEFAGEPCTLVAKLKRGWHGEIRGLSFKVMPRMLDQQVA